MTIPVHSKPYLSRKSQKIRARERGDKVREQEVRGTMNSTRKTTATMGKGKTAQERESLKLIKQGTAC